MQIVSLDKITARPSDIVFRQSRVSLAMSTLFGVALTAGGMAFFKSQSGSSDWMPWLWAVLIIATGLLWRSIAFGMLRASWRHTNWLLRTNGDVVLIKYRSYSNWRFPEDEPQIISLPRSEIAFIRPASEWRKTRKLAHAGGNTISEKFSYLDIGLRNPADGLQQALMQEMNHAPVGKRFVRTKMVDNPVQVIDPSTIRLTWRSATARIVPGLNGAVDQLGMLAKVHPEVRVDEVISRDGLQTPGYDPPQHET
ncbi:MAG: hypothetical protein H7144_14315 [Burkholderiales bacterium]|nr:hypothetical protein [Phycisphaerae bacterium]